MTDEPQEGKGKQHERAMGGEIAPPMVKILPSPSGIKEIYANFVAFSWTQYDIRFRLAQIIPSPETPPIPEFVAEERAAVTLTWPHAKALNQILSDLVKQYEQTNGQIEFPKLPSL